MALSEQQVQEMRQKYGIKVPEVAAPTQSSRFDASPEPIKSRFDSIQSSVPEQTKPEEDKNAIDYAMEYIPKGVDLAEKAIKFTGVPKLIGKTVGALGYGLGGLIGGAAETGMQLAKKAKGGTFDTAKIGEMAKSVAQDTSGFGEETGVNAGVAAPFMGLGKIPSAIVAAPTLYQGIKEKDPTKIAIGGLGLVGAKYAKGALVDKELASGLSSLRKTGLPNIISKEGGQTEKILNTAIDKGIKPGFSGIKSAASRERYYSNGREALQTIRDAEPKFADEAGELVTRAPKTRLETLDALGQAKENIFKKYNDLATQAGDTGAKFDATPTIEKLNILTGNKKYSPETRAYAQKLANDLAELHGENPTVVQERIKDLNNSLGAFYEGRASKAAAQVDASAANSLTEQLDKQINSLTGDNYQQLRSQYASLKTIEKDLSRQAAIEARKNPKSLLDMTDLFTGGDITAGILTANPALVAKGAAARGFKEYMKWINDPNRYIKNAFEHLYSLPAREAPLVKKPVISGLLGEPAIQPPVGERPYTPTTLGQQYATTVPPTELNKLRGIKELPYNNSIELPGPGILQGQANIKQPAINKSKAIEGSVVPPKKPLKSSLKKKSMPITVQGGSKKYLDLPEGVTIPLEKKKLSNVLSKKMIDETTKKAFTSDYALMDEFINHVNGKFPENVQLETEARRMAEAMGINPDQTNKELAKKFNTIVDAREKIDQSIKKAKPSKK